MTLVGQFLLWTKPDNKLFSTSPEMFSFTYLLTEGLCSSLFFLGRPCGRGSSHLYMCPLVDTKVKASEYDLTE